MSKSGKFDSENFTIGYFYSRVVSVGGGDEDGGRLDIPVYQTWEFGYKKKKSKSEKKIGIQKVIKIDCISENTTFKNRKRKHVSLKLHEKI
jgi:hypothetical protein